MSITAYLPTGDDTLVAPQSIPAPQPADSEALVAVDAYSINRGEILLLKSGSQEPPGKDIAGRILQPAADGSGPPANSRVVAHLDGGGWAEQVAVTATQLVTLPESVSTVVAAALPLAGLTALRLFDQAAPTTGKRILITGASGGVGHAFVELAASKGADVTAVTASPERGRGLLERGARHLVQDVNAAGGDYDLVLESIGGGTLASALLQLKNGGELIWFGQASDQPATIDFFSTVYGPGEITIRTFAYYARSDHDRDDLQRLVDLVATSHLHPELGRTADWHTTPQALTDLLARRITGNAVLTITTPTTTPH